MKRARRRGRKDGLAAGIHDLPRAAYDADPAARPSLNASIAKLLLDRSPAHAWLAHPRLNPAFAAEAERRFDLGTAAHAALLGGAASLAIVAAPDYKTEGARLKRRRLLAQGFVPLLAAEHGRVTAMLEALRRQLAHHREIAGVFEAPGGEAERTAIWREGKRGIWCRARPDWIRRGERIVIDYKTVTGSAHPDDWSQRQLFDLGADLQAAHYTRGLRALTGETWTFRFVVQESEPPYALSVVALAPDAEQAAEARMDEARALWARCLREDRWPAYAANTYHAGLPPWRARREEDSALRKAVHPDLLKLGMEVHAPTERRP
jgi:hypothetical protein